VRLYVIGAEGQLARSLREAATLDPDIVVGCGGRPNVDIVQPDLVENALLAFSPDIVINSAAYTAVDRAESEPEHAFAVNRDGAGIVAAATARLGIPIVHMSTDSTARRKVLTLRPMPRHHKVFMDAQSLQGSLLSRQPTIAI
jgi:dTDP-4-dehydrorhamnose reductase